MSLCCIDGGPSWEGGGITFEDALRWWLAADFREPGLSTGISRFGESLMCSPVHAATGRPWSKRTWASARQQKNDSLSQCGVMIGAALLAIVLFWDLAFAAEPDADAVLPDPTGLALDHQTGFLF